MVTSSLLGITIRVVIRGEIRTLNGVNECIGSTNVHVSADYSYSQIPFQDQKNLASC